MTTASLSTNLINHGHLTQAVEIVYLSGTAQRRHAMQLDPSDRRTLCGRKVRGERYIGDETINVRNIGCISCLKALQQQGILVEAPAFEAVALVGYDAETDQLTNIEKFKAQGELAPGTAGYWKLWGARLQDLQANDIFAYKARDDEHASEWFEVASTERAPSGLRQHVVTTDGQDFYLGLLVSVVIVRPETHNTLAR